MEMLGNSSAVSFVGDVAVDVVDCSSSVSSDVSAVVSVAFAISATKESCSTSGVAGACDASDVIRNFARRSMVSFVVASKSSSAASVSMFISSLCSS